MTTPTRPSAIDAIRPLPRQHRMWLFAQEYVLDHNATQAAIRAGYSKRVAHVNGPSSPSEKHGWRVFGGMMGPVQ